MTTFDEIFNNLKKDFHDEKYFEVIMKTPEFIDLFCSDVIGNFYQAGNNSLKKDYSKNDVEFITSNYNRLINRKKAIRSETKWQSTFLSLVELMILGVFTDPIEFKVTKEPFLQIVPKLMDKYDQLKETRNNIAHSYFRKKYSKSNLYEYAKNAIELCEIYKLFEPLGYLSDEIDL